MFADKYGAKYEKAVACLTEDRNALLAFFDFPAGTGIICGHRIRSRACSRRGGIERCGRRENVATIEGRKSVAQSRPRRQIPKRHRSHQNAGSPRRLIDLVTSAHRFVMAGNGLTGQIAMSRRFTHSTASLANFRASRIELHYQLRSLPQAFAGRGDRPPCRALLPWAGEDYRR